MRLHFVELAQLLDIRAVLLVELGVFDRQSRLAAEGDEKINLAGLKGSRLPSGHRIDDAERPPLNRIDGDAKKRPDRLGAGDVMRIPESVFRPIRLPALKRPARHPFPEAQTQRALDFKISASHP